jgi:ATP-dependent helicase HepA
MEKSFFKGQRWISESEPELGLGIIVHSGYRDVKIDFPGAGETRVYRKSNAPLQRVKYTKGDIIRDRSGRGLTVQSVEERDHLAYYRCGERTLAENFLMDLMTFNRPEERLAKGKPGHVKDFELRYKTLLHRQKIMTAPWHGLLGARIELIEHQLYIARDAASLFYPRVLLADEVGLGKTIEAGLIFHKLLVSGTVNRVLVISPHSLLNQWLVELYRRFNILFTILDEEQYASRSEMSPDSNPFTSSTTVICSLDFISSNREALRHAGKAGWDMLIVDEAHHLKMNGPHVSPEYRAIQELSRAAKALLLLTATPLQLGEEGHFGRLQLLDRDRFTDYQKYLQESSEYKKVASLANDIRENKITTKAMFSRLERQYKGDTQLLDRVKGIKRVTRKIRDTLIQDLLDRYGTGRMVYRNRRSVLKGFPKRMLKPVKMNYSEDYRKRYTELLHHLNWKGEYIFFDPFSLTPAHLNLPQKEAGQLLKHLWMEDPRLSWLIQFIRKLPKQEKALIICNRPGKVFSIRETLPMLIRENFVVFHEDLSLNIRDKNAADFSRPDGVRLLISSEIGSEGRNFQYARHLILFDLPRSPELLEQRIGRLHRIGQKRDVFIYALFPDQSTVHALFNLYHEGLDAFLSPTMAGEYVYRSVKKELELNTSRMVRREMPSTEWKQSIDAIIRKARKELKTYTKLIESGRDCLLEINSLQAASAKVLIEEMKLSDSSYELEAYMEDVFEAYGISFQPTVEKRGYTVYPGPEMTLDSFPGLPETGLAVTFDREQALVREDMTFLTWEHPLVSGAMDLILGNSYNAVCIAEWKNAPESGILLDLIYILEPVKSRTSAIQQYLPPTPIRTLLDLKANLRTDLVESLKKVRLKQGLQSLVRESREFRENILPALLSAGKHEAELRAEKIRNAAHKKAQNELNSEISRFDALSRLNNSNAKACMKNAQLLKRELEKVLNYLDDAELRLDSLRVIQMTR